jgi:hypothetical protein
VKARNRVVGKSRSGVTIDSRELRRRAGSGGSRNSRSELNQSKKPIPSVEASSRAPPQRSKQYPQGTPQRSKQNPQGTPQTFDS